MVSLEMVVWRGSPFCCCRLSSGGSFLLLCNCLNATSSPLLLWAQAAHSAGLAHLLLALWLRLDLVCLLCLLTFYSCSSCWYFRQLCFECLVSAVVVSTLYGCCSRRVSLKQSVLLLCGGCRPHLLWLLYSLGLGYSRGSNTSPGSVWVVYYVLSLFIK